MHRSIVAACCLLSLCAITSAKSINHKRHVALHGGDLGSLIDLDVDVNAFTGNGHRHDVRRNLLAHLMKRDGTWTVQAGDTGNGIAARLSITFLQLAFMNPTIEWHNLQIGQVLNIPCSDGSSGATPYTVVAGDTGNAIAAANGITFDQLSAANPGVNWLNLQIGQVLLIPSVTETTATMASKVASMPDAATLEEDANTVATPAANASQSTNDSTSADMNADVVDVPASAAAPALPVATKSPFLTPGSDGGSRKIRKARDDRANAGLIPSLPTPVSLSTTLPSSGALSTYTVKAGDTGLIITALLGTTFAQLEQANPGVIWTNLQIGQKLKLPQGISLPTGVPSVPSIPGIPSVPTAPSVPSVPSVPGIPTIPTIPSIPSIPGVPVTTRRPGQDIYMLYTGSAAKPPYPAMSSWLDFNTMWTNNLANIGTNCEFSSGTVTPNTQAETAALKAAVTSIATSTNVNPSFILAMVMQESAGCVRVPTTSSWEGITNPGLLQSYKGTATCNTNGQTTSPCPARTILQMLSEGIKGNQGVGILPALQQAATMLNTTFPVSTTTKSKRESYAIGDVIIARDGPYAVGNPIMASGPSKGKVVDPALVYYVAARIYNSGSVPADGDLSAATGATRTYVSDIVNRLMGWVNAQKDVPSSFR